MNQKLRMLASEQDWICALCGDEMKPEEVSTDHIVPVVLGGKKGPVRATHKICNSIRGHDMRELPLEYYRSRRLDVESRLARRKSKKWIPKKVIPLKLVKHDDKGVSFFDLTEELFKR
jgi:hypothetical protein